MYKIKTLLLGAIIFAVCLFSGINVYADTLNPSMGDTAGRYIWVFAAVAGIALVAVIVTAVMGKKGGKK